VQSNLSTTFFINLIYHLPNELLNATSVTRFLKTLTPVTGDAGVTGT